MRSFIRLITNKWLQLGSFVINLAFFISVLVSYINLNLEDKNYALKKQICLFCLVVFGLFIVAQIVSYFLKINLDRKKVDKILEEREKMKKA